MGFPSWVEKHRAPGREIHRRGDHYYLYEIERRKDKKVTGKYLGKISREGLVPPRHERRAFGGALEAGNIRFLQPFAEVLKPVLVEEFPHDWQTLLAAAVLKLCYREPGSRLHLRYETSLAKRVWPEAALSDDALPDLWRRIGSQWDAQRSVFRSLSRDEKHMAIDLSHVFSESQNIPWLEYGHNGDDVARPQLQLLLCWGTTTHRPGYLQLLPGATHSAQTIAHTLQEADFQEAVAVVDKGFWSPKNVAAFEAAGVHYAMALKRDLPIVHLAPHHQYRSYFLYRGDPQYYRSDEKDGRTLHHYLDKKLAVDEEAVYLRRIDETDSEEEKKRIRSSLRDARPGLGTLSILTDTGLDAADVYGLYRERRDVEYAFDALQNDLQSDVTWMRSRESMVGYHFVLFLSLHLHSQVLEHLRRKQLLKTYSVRDVLTHLSKVMVVEEDGNDYPLPITRQTRTILDRLEKPVTQTAGL